MTQEQERVMTILMPLMGSHVTIDMLENAVNEICKLSENSGQEEKPFSPILKDSIKIPEMIVTKKF